MKFCFVRIGLLTFFLASLFSVAQAQRTISGTVYKEGKPAAGITVTGHKSKESFMTSFDGKYQIAVGEGSKWLKFTFIDESKRLDLEANPKNEIDFYFDGKAPAAAAGRGEADLRTVDQLVEAKESDFLNDYSMFDQAVKEKKYDEAIPYLKNLLNKYPRSTRNLYIHGASIYSEKIEKAKDEKVKDEYVDTLMRIYDQRIKHFPDDKGRVLGRRGSNFIAFKIRESLSDDDIKQLYKAGYNDLKASIDLLKNDTDAADVDFFMKTTTRLARMGELSSDEVMANYNTATEIIDAQIAKEAGNVGLLAVKESIDNTFLRSGAADCETLVDGYSAKFDEIKDDADKLGVMLRALDSQDCTDSELYAKATESQYKLNPSAEAAYNMAGLFLKRNDNEQAKKYLNEAISQEEDPIKLARSYLRLANFTMTVEKKAAEARGYARKAIENDPNLAKAYILIGDIYAASAASYGKDDNEHRQVYWVAVDYYEKAKRIDPNEFQLANERITKFMQHFPDKETLFFLGFTEGQAITIGSWINEQTRVRARK
ncbi:MAG: tetratricopeptide repeat protein [Bacteroidales bacterium]|jgi:tetratricopeptide (TPR) repeat protein|nr:tetratricopeptide repeat protein [Bacteroidales bacterium]